VLALKVSLFDSSNGKINVQVDVVVDGKPFNGRMVCLESKSEAILVNVGQTVRLIVRSNGAVVETSGQVKSVDKSNGTVTVLSSTGATMVGRATSANTVEVVL